MAVVAIITGHIKKYARNLTANMSAKKCTQDVLNVTARTLNYLFITHTCYVCPKLDDSQNWATVSIYIYIFGYCYIRTVFINCRFTSQVIIYDSWLGEDNSMYSISIRTLPDLLVYHDLIFSVHQQPPAPI